MNLGKFIPLIILIAIGTTFYFNKYVPVKNIEGRTVIQSKVNPVFHETLGEKVDSNVTIKHLPSGDSFSFDFWNNNILLPDGKTELPTRRNPDGTITKLWEITQSRNSALFTTGWDFGIYTGYLDGKKEGTSISPVAIGVRISPLRAIYDTTALDLLVSNQSAGIGISIYPAPERFGKIWRHFGIGLGKVISYEDQEYRNVFYLSFSTQF
jgi:hypothetical protein